MFVWMPFTWGQGAKSMFCLTKLYTPPYNPGLQAFFLKSRPVSTVESSTSLSLSLSLSLEKIPSPSNSYLLPRLHNCFTRLDVPTLSPLQWGLEFACSTLFVSGVLCILLRFPHTQDKTPCTPGRRSSRQFTTLWTVCVTAVHPWVPASLPSIFVPCVHHDAPGNRRKNPNKCYQRNCFLLQDLGLAWSGLLVKLSFF